MQISPSVRYHPTVCRPSVYFYSFWFHLAPFLIFFRAYCLFLFYFFCLFLLFVLLFISFLFSFCVFLLVFSSLLGLWVFFFPRSAIHNAVLYLGFTLCAVNIKSMHPQEMFVPLSPFLRPSVSCCYLMQEITCVPMELNIFSSVPPNQLLCLICFACER